MRTGRAERVPTAGARDSRRAPPSAGRAAPIRVDRDAGAVALQGHRAGRSQQPGRAIGGQPLARVPRSELVAATRPAAAAGHVEVGQGLAPPSARSRSGRRPPRTRVGDRPGRSAGSTSHCTAGPTWCGTRARPPPLATTAVAGRQRGRADEPGDPAAAPAAPDPAGRAATAGPGGEEPVETSASGTAVHVDARADLAGRPRGGPDRAPWTANGPFAQGRVEAGRVELADQYGPRRATSRAQHRGVEGSPAGPRSRPVGWPSWWQWWTWPV